MNHLDGRGSRQNPLGLPPERVADEQGEDRPQPLGGSEQAVGDGRLDAGRASGSVEATERLFDLKALVFQDGREAVGAGICHGRQAGAVTIAMVIARSCPGAAADGGGGTEPLP